MLQDSPPPSDPGPPTSDRSLDELLGSDSDSFVEVPPQEHGAPSTSLLEIPRPSEIGPRTLDRTIDELLVLQGARNKPQEGHGGAGHRQNQKPGGEGSPRLGRRAEDPGGPTSLSHRGRHLANAKVRPPPLQPEKVPKLRSRTLPNLKRESQSDQLLPLPQGKEVHLLGHVLPLHKLLHQGPPVPGGNWSLSQGYSRGSHPPSSSSGTMGTDTPARLRDFMRTLRQGARDLQRAQYHLIWRIKSEEVVQGLRL